MASVAGELRTWLALAAIVLALAAGLAMRSSTAEPASVADSGPSLRPHASPPPAAEPMAPPNPPLTDVITPPTQAPAPTSTAAPAASSTPAPVAVAPSAPPPAPAPAAPAPTPVPVHDDEPVLLTEERVDGSFGQTLTIGGYSVHAVRVTSPQATCEENLTPDMEVFDITITYSGPIFSVHFALPESTERWCITGEGGASQLFPSGVTKQIVVKAGEDYGTGTDAALTVWITAENGPHTMTFAFH